jgi:hypothetical protein
MRSLLLLVFFCCTGALTAQDSITCKVYQFFGTDSGAQEVAIKMVHNLRGQLTYKHVRNHSTQGNTGFIENGSEYWYTYNDTFLTEVVHQAFNGTKTKTVYTYENARLIRESRFNWELNQAPQPYRPPGMPGVSNEPAGKWNQVTEARIAYDAKGRKISWDASRLHYEAVNLYKWEYNDDNKVATYQGFRRGGQVAWKQEYQYFEWGYRYWTAVYNESGEMRHELEPGQGHQPMIIHTVTLNKDGRIAEDKESDEKSNPRGSIVYSYDKTGRVLRDVCYNEKQEKAVTHIYQYR